MTFLLRLQLEEDGKRCKKCNGSLGVFDYEGVYEKDRHVFIMEVECDDCGEMYIEKSYDYYPKRKRVMED